MRRVGTRGRRGRFALTVGLDASFAADIAALRNSGPVLIGSVFMVSRIKSKSVGAFIFGADSRIDPFTRLADNAVITALIISRCLYRPLRIRPQIVGRFARRGGFCLSALGFYRVGIRFRKRFNVCGGIKAFSGFRRFADFTCL